MSWATLAWAYPLWVACWSALGFVVIRADKQRAKLGKVRVAERTLHTLSLVGGWPGVVWGMQRLRHKTRKPRFVMTTALVTALHLAGLIAVAAWTLP